MKSIFQTLLLTAAIGALTVAPASAETFTFLRPGNPVRAFQQNEPLRVALPPGLSADELNQLFLELNGIDITQLVTLDNGTVIFYPSSPYTAGSQTLRLVRLGKNGKLVELNNWNFTVASAPPVSSPSSVSGSVDGTYNFLAFENGKMGETPDRHNLTSQFRVEGATQQGDWQFKGRAKGFLNSDADFNPAGDALEVGEYLLSAERPGDEVDAAFRLGHHNIGASNLLMDQFYRRGASAHFNFNDRASVTGFAQNPAALFGNRDFTGLENGNQRVQGLHATFRPVNNSDTTIEATAYDGSGSLLNTTVGTAVAATETASRDGSGYQLGIFSTVVPDYASVRGQAALSKFDPDGSGIVSSTQDDQAGRMALLLSPLGRQLSDDGRLRLWNVELAYQQVGTFFQSLLNPLMVADRNTYSVTSNYLQGGTTLDGQVAWVTDNVNNESALPDNRSLNGWVQASHALDAQLPGRPVLFAGASVTDENRLDTPFGYIGPSLDRFASSVNGGVALSYDTTTLNLTHTYSNLRDSIDGANDYDSHYTDLTMEFRPNERLTFRPGFQMENTDQESTGDSHAYHFSLGGDMIIIPDKLWNNTNLSFLLNEGANSVRDNTTTQTEFTWLLKPAETNSPGYAIGLAGQYGYMTDPVTRLVEDEKEGRIFLRLKVSAPFSF